MKKRLPLMVLGILPFSSVVHGQEKKPDFTWMLSYRDKGENSLALDKRFESFLTSNLRAVPFPDFSNESVNKVAIQFLGGVPGDLEVRSNRYLTASGCPPHACVERAMIWVDTLSDIVAFVATADEDRNNEKSTRDHYPIASAKLYAATKPSLTPDQFPDELHIAISRWLHVEGVLRLTEVNLLTPSGPKTITADKFW